MALAILNGIMNKSRFLEIMNFPREWNDWQLYPDELATIQMSEYKSCHEDASEHTRAGAFHWWLSKEPSIDILGKLLFLASIDPEPYLGLDIREYIRKSPYYSLEVEKSWKS